MGEATHEARHGEGAARPSYFQRFSWTQRLEHTMVMVTFLTLALTGLPQRYFDTAWGEWLIIRLGGIDQVRVIHRTASWLFAFAAFYHVARVLYDWFGRGFRPSMFVGIADLRDVVNNVRYYLGFSPRKPKFDRYGYQQKFEYWGLVFGSFIMLTSGFVLMYPTWVTRWLPGQFILAAKMAHGYEGLLAVLVIVVWHLYGAHLGRGRFPMDTTIFTGRISRERLEEEHALEYERLAAGPQTEGGAAGPWSGKEAGS